MKPRLYFFDVEKRECHAVPDDWMNFEGWEFNLEDGNNSCDCNRAMVFGILDHPCGDGRFIVVADNGYTNPRLHSSTIKAYVLRRHARSPRWV